MPRLLLRRRQNTGFRRSLRTFKRWSCAAAQDACAQPLCGWFGHTAPFAFDASYSPAPGIQRFLCGTPPILSLAAMEARMQTLSLFRARYTLGTMEAWSLDNEQAATFMQGGLPHKPCLRRRCVLPQVGVDLAIEADAAAVALKSQGLGTLFQRAMAAECASFGFRLASPEDPGLRGSQICYGHQEGYAIIQVTCASQSFADV